MEDKVKSISFNNKTKNVVPQQKLEIDQIKQKLQNYKRITTTEELKNVPIGKWIKYYNIEKQELKSGGKLVANGAPDHFVLKNIFNNNFTWVIKLDKNIIFMYENEKLEKEKKEKDELFRLYKEGKLELKKN